MSEHLRDLDDVDGLIAADHHGLLRSAATSGAHVRAVAHAVAEGALAPLVDLRPRSVVVVTGTSASARRAAELVVALLASHVDVPLVVAPTLPGWIGPLDVVVAVGDDAGDRSYADAALRALRRRAELVAAVPVEGPFSDAVGAQSIADLSPRLPVDARFGFVRFVAVIVAVCTAFEAVRTHPVPPSLADIADRLDEEAAADHPDTESFRNQAKLLATRMAGRTVAWAGDSPASTTIAEHIAATVYSVAGTAAAAGPEAGVLAQQHVRARTGAASGDSIFYDPDFDDAPPADRSRVMLLTTSARSRVVQQRTAGFEDVDIVTEQVGVPDDVSEHPLGPSGAEFGDVPADLAAYLTVAVRADFAAVYLELTGAAAR